ncbi:MAG: outer membrane beta-barrel protein [Verrucomicrobiota bacterium]
MKIQQTGLVLIAMTALASAGETVSSSTYTQMTAPPPPSLSLYNAGEWQVDLFGNYAFADSGNDRLIDDDAWGGGLGFNYFFTRNFGIGAEGSLFKTGGDTLGTSAFNLVLRFPIGETGLAPYLYGGVGLTFNADDLDSDDFRDARERAEDDDRPRNGDDVLFLGHAGAGIEYRFTQHVGIFTDARYTWCDQHDSDFGLARAGVRFAF